MPEQHDQDGGSITVTTTRPAPTKPKPRLLPQWKVLLHNDDVNDMRYVVDSICALTSLVEQQAIVCMVEAHQSGVALLLTTHQEHAELLEEQFASKQLTVTIEPDEA